MYVPSKRFLLEAHTDCSHRLLVVVLQMYQLFISKFEERISQLQLVIILTHVAGTLYRSRPYVAAGECTARGRHRPRPRSTSLTALPACFAVAELDAATAFLSDFLAKKARLGADAYLVLTVELTALKVRKAGALQGGAGAGAGAGAGSSDAVTTLLDEAKKELQEEQMALDALPDGTDPVVPAAYHHAAAEYSKVRGPPQALYEHSLAYLAHTQLTSLAPAVLHDIAVDIAVAALVADSVYNFGELNSHAIMSSLTGSPQAWLVDLLKAYQTGDIDAFNAVISSKGAALEAIPALAGARPVMQEKLTLLSIMELAARRPGESCSCTDEVALRLLVLLCSCSPRTAVLSVPLCAAHERSLSFADIAAHARVSVDAVELLLIRAMSLGLLKGKIDQTEATVHVTYVKPRVLDKEQIAVVKERVEAWRQKVGTALTFLEEHTQELLA